MGWKEKRQVFLAEFSKVTERGGASDFERYVKSLTQKKEMIYVYRDCSPT